MGGSRVMQVIINADDLATMIRQEVQTAMRPLIDALHDAEYNKLPDLMTKSTAARYLCVHVTTVDRYIRQGRLKVDSGKVVKGTIRDVVKKRK